MKRLKTCLVFAIASVAWAWQRLFAREQETEQFANVFTDGTHEAALTRLTDAAITTRGLLYKKGTDDNHVAICAATADCPLGVIDDEADAAEKEIAVLILGKGPTKRMIASEAIAVGDALFTTTTGKVQNFPGAGVATYWQVGVALTAASGDGVLVEVADCVPVKLAVLA